MGIAAISGEGWYDENTPVTLTAPSLVSVSPGVRYRFDHWDVDGTSQGAGINPITVTMNGPRTATAHYVKQYYLTVQTNPVSIATIPGEGWYDESTPVQLTAPAGPCIAPNGYQYFFAEWTSQGNGVNPITVQMDGPHTATANYVTPQTLGFSWTGPAKVKKGSTATYTAVYTITANVPLTNVKVQGGIGAKAKNLKIYLDGKLVDVLGSLASKDWTKYSDNTPFPAGITLKLDVSKINNVFVLRISSMAAGESHQLSITFDWTFTSTGAEKITDSWTATCTSTFGTTTTPNTNKIMVKVS